MYKYSGIYFVILFEVLLCFVSCLKFHLLYKFFFSIKILGFTF